MSKPSSSINATAAAAGVSRVKVLMDSACQASPRDIAKHSDGPRRWSTTNILMLATAAYFLLCGAFVASPYLQSTLVYLHIARWPLGDLTNLSRFGLAEARTVTINMNGSDTLEGYHIMPPGRGAIAGAALEGPERDRFFEDLLREASSVVVYLHGNAGTRAHHRRVAVQKHIAAYCNAHVLTFDYRGFGDSVGTPTEQGTVEDVHAILSYIEDLNISKDVKVYLYAESLGTGIALSFLEAHPEAAYPRGIVRGMLLLAPFTSLPEASLAHPVGAPFRIFPIVKDLMLHYLHFRYPSIDTISAVQVPILVLHGTADYMIPVSHGRDLFSAYARGDDAGSCPAAGTSSSGHSCKSCSKYVEIVGAGHDDLFMTKEWLLEVPKFIASHCS